MDRKYVNKITTAAKMEARKGIEGRKYISTRKNKRKQQWTLATSRMKNLKDQILQRF